MCIRDRSERVLYTAVFYLGALLLFFSMLRRYKAGTIWTGSFVCRWSEHLSIFFTGQSFTTRLTVSFLAYAAINTSLISLAWFLWDRIYLSKTAVYALTGMVILACAAFNLWIFYLMFKHSVEHDMISTAIEHLSAGETSYQVNLDDFDGKEYELAANINNISMGPVSYTHLDVYKRQLLMGWPWLRPVTAESMSFALIILSL